MSVLTWLMDELGDRQVEGFDDALTALGDWVGEPEGSSADRLLLCKTATDSRFP